MREGFEYAVAWLLLKFLGVLPRRVARWTGAHLGALLFQSKPIWRTSALLNLRIAFPDWTDARRQQTVEKMVRNLGWMAAEFAQLPGYTRENIGAAIVLDGFENFLAAERQGK